MDKNELKNFAEMLLSSASDKTEGPSVEEQRNILKAVASDPVARKEYAESRAGVILEQIPRQTTVRKIFSVEELPAGAQAYYPISFDYTNLGSFMPKFGGNVVKVLEGNELYIPTFGIEAAYRYSMDIAAQGRLDMAALATQTLKDEIVRKEEYVGWRTIKGTLSGLNTDQVVYCSGTEEVFHAFSKKAINKMAVQMDVQRREMTDIYISPRSLGDIKEWSSQQVDYLTQRDIFVNGGLPNGMIWDIRLNKVYDSSLVADTEAYGFDTNKFGKMPIRQTLQTFDDPTAIQQWQIGIMARELVGFGCTDSWAVVKAVLDSTHVTTTCSSF